MYVLRREMGKALIISSDEGTRYLYELAISYQKISVFVADTIAAGVKMVSKERPDIIILDIMVPDIRDVGALQALKGEVGSCPLVIMTDLKNSNRKNEATILGAVKTMVKSQSSLGELIKTVRKAVDK
jgi:DNA-binding response OmpR family regulator